MNQFPHVEHGINVINLHPSAGSGSMVVIKVERLLKEYIKTTPNSEPIYYFSYHYRSPQLLNFHITSTNRPLQLLQILRNELQLSPELSQSLCAEIFLKDAQNFGGNAIVINVLVQISYNAVLDFDFSPSDGEEEASDEEEDNHDFIDNFVRNREIGEELGLENESCAICLDNLLEDSDKIPIRMDCSHLFHDRCISEWLRLKESCPLCRQELY